MASIASSLPRIKRSLRKRAPYRDLEEAPKRSGSDYARKCAIFKERIAYLVNRVRGQICPHAESVPSLPLRKTCRKTCPLCYGRPRSQHAAPSLILNDSMCASRSTAPAQVLANMFSSASRLSSALPCTCSNCKVPSQISSTCYSRILAQLQSSKQNLELGHVLYLKSEAPRDQVKVASISNTKSDETQMHSLTRSVRRQRRRRRHEPYRFILTCQQRRVCL